MAPGREVAILQVSLPDERTQRYEHRSDITGIPSCLRPILPGEISYPHAYDEPDCSGRETEHESCSESPEDGPVRCHRRRRRRREVECERNRTTHRQTYKQPSVVMGINDRWDGTHEGECPDHPWRGDRDVVSMRLKTHETAQRARPKTYTPTVARKPSFVARASPPKRNALKRCCRTK